MVGSSYFSSETEARIHFVFYPKLFYIIVLLRAMSTLTVRVWPDCWAFESPPGDVFNLEKLPKQQRQQAAELLDKRYVGTL